MSNNYYCYILRSMNPNYSNITYNGSTNNLKRRIRQHNGEIVGGAKYTKDKGPWEYYLIIEGFVDRKEALSCEWRIKHPINKKYRPKKYCGREGRIKSLNLILNLEKWTNKCENININNEYKIYINPDYKDILELKRDNFKILDLDEIF